MEKFKSLLLAGSFTVLANYVVRLSDSIIAGNMLGSEALAGVNLVCPCLAAISFLSGLISTGVVTCYSLAMGRRDQRRAREFFMQGIWSILIFGGVLAALLGFGREWFLGYFHADAVTTGFARDYMKWIWLIAFADCFENLFAALGYADGDSRLCMAAYGVIFVVNIVLSIVLVRCGWGTSGCAIASVVASVAGVLVLSLHFPKKSNTFRPVLHCSMRDALRIFGSSFGDAAAFLCDGVLFFFLNKFVIMNFGSEWLPIVGVVTALWGFLEFFNGIGMAIQPIVTVYYGERNTRSIRSVMNSAMRWALGEGLAFSVICMVFPELAGKAVGITDPVLIENSVIAVRLMSVGFVALSFAGLFNSYYMFIEKSALAGSVTFLSYLLMPIAAVATGALLGVNGVWLGLGVGPFLGLLVTSLVIISVSGFGMYPLLLDRSREAKLHVFDLVLTDTEIAAVSRQVGALEGVPMKAALMTEEVFMVVKDRAKGRKLLGEAVVDLNDGVELTLRDDGEIFDITDADQQISSLRTFLVASMMQAHTGRMNLVTTGFNRNVFRF